MSIVKTIFTRLLYGGTSKLRPYETACLDAFKKVLPEQGAAILGRQLARLSLIQRSPNGSLVTFFDPTDQTCATWSDQDFFPLRSEETPVTRVWLRPTTRKNGLEIKADVVLHRGRIASIEFNKTPRSLDRGLCVLKAEVLNDPMLQIETAYAGKSLSEIEPGLRKRLNGLTLGDLHQPLSPDRRQKLIGNLDAKLPDDYVEFVAQSEGATINGWLIRGLSQIRRIVQPQGNYYVLAEMAERGSVGVAQDSNDGNLYFLGNEDETPRAVGSSLLAFVRGDTAENTQST